MSCRGHFPVSLFKLQAAGALLCRLVIVESGGARLVTGRQGVVWSGSGTTTSMAEFF